MRVVSLVNGSLLSEAASLYAIDYARSVKLPLTLLFIDNGEESVEKLHLSVASLKELADAVDVTVETVILQGDMLTQLKHFVQLYAIDTLFCATRKLSKSHSFSEKIVGAGLETALAVVKVKNVPQVRSYHRVMLAAGKAINPHAYLLWLGLLNDGDSLGKLYLQNSRSAFKASTKSGLKYEAAPFVQIAKMLNQNVEVVNTLQPVDPEEMNNYLIANDLDLAIYDANAYTQRMLNHLTDESSINSIIFYPWKA
ncbi:universal stress protein [Thiomicrorhabdus sp. ZW0627]|uniref:universal stress protein n=1 Tax=Thiomicrorhabdus sp. ZW0627 TaxID=3039774 RepID=UPI002436FD0B|nr:universal stress protein [Thiomicrorhabdus sp. ZW0627]MDG6774188.1 universal stress protein [Thiomicrorhabdus sp. ZW0627]